MSAESWPPQLKEWVAKCLGQMTDANREEAQAELRGIISSAFAAKTLWSTDWNGLQLKSLMPKPPPVYNLKRKSVEGQLPGKKAKKANNNKTLAYVQDNFNDQAALNRRAERFQREHDIERNKAFQPSQKPPAKYNYRPAPAFDAAADPNVINWDRYTIVGTCQDIFKDYLRLTSEPKPETIRPYNVLQQTLLALKKKWKERCTYPWMCNQLKSLRQDLTVQRIKNEFTVQVYEIHARIALESIDMVEYNQCQATLRTLYDLGIPGKVEEFSAYRILMLLHGRNRSELNLYVGQLTPQQKADAAVKHALDVQRAMAMGNYHAFFELYTTAPNMGAYIMDHFIDRERAKALLVITKAYKEVPLTFITKELAFETLEDARLFLADHGADTFKDPRHPDSQKVLECKSAHAKIAEVFEEKYRRVLIKGAI
ncbi:hypothetical protein D9611_014670 [Ephemerocybe angulata]|uniref:PCI domain-containing protein n=1 Tax=Ephemerocybe angulata TaxID=980116 RepID=A0A8H5ER07_9AGAR|nr:hypothetical protein D9611_014670 [Tulosesus angulatus]